MSFVLALRAPWESLQSPQNRSGLSGENRPNVTWPGAAVERPPRPGWVSEALLAETVEVWSEMYGRAISEEEALEMLANVKRLGEALLTAKKEMRR